MVRQRQRRRYLLGCLKAFLKAGFERKFYDLGKVDYWGPQSRKKVDFHFDAARTRAADQDVEWQATHNRKAKRPEGPALACGGGTAQMAGAMIDAADAAGGGHADRLAH